MMVTHKVKGKVKNAGGGVAVGIRCGAKRDAKIKGAFSPDG